MLEGLDLQCIVLGTIVCVITLVIKYAGETIPLMLLLRVS